jgi:hypothetical protein
MDADTKITKNHNIGPLSLKNDDDIGGHLRWSHHRIFVGKCMCGNIYEW